MEEKRQDRRVQRTRKELKDALMGLILEGRYDALSIQEITDRANLGRATFYLHYRDKEALLLECMQDIVAKFILKIQAIPIGQWALTDGAPVQEVFEYAGEHARLYQVIMSSQRGVQVSRQLHELIAQNTRHVLEGQIRERGITPRLPVVFISNYFAGSLLALVYWWLEKEAPYTAQEMAEMFRQISLFGRAHALGMDPFTGLD